MQDALISMEKTYMQQIHPKMQKIDPAKLIQSRREMTYIHLINTNNQISEACSFRYFRDNIKRVIVILN